jgi:predicted GNAT family acetyltransferase
VSDGTTDRGPAPEVVDDTAHSRFLVRTDGLESQLQYRARGERLVLVHTEVPDALSGRGIAGALVRAAVARAARDGLTVAPWCPYARRWLERHPDEAGAITIDWSPPPPR